MLSHVRTHWGRAQNGETFVSESFNLKITLKSTFAYTFVAPSAPNYFKMAKLVKPVVIGGVNLFHWMSNSNYTQFHSYFFDFLVL